MKKIALLLNMIVASVNVFGMNVQYSEGINSIKNHTLHLVRSEDRAIMKKSEIRHLGILNSRYLKFSKRLTQFIQNNLVEKKEAYSLRAADTETVKNQSVQIYNELQCVRQQKIDNQKQEEELKKEIARIKNLQNVKQMEELEGKRKEADKLIAIKQKQLDETERKLQEIIQVLELVKSNKGISGMSRMSESFVFSHTQSWNN